MNMGDLVLAVADFSRVLEIDPNMVLAYTNRGLTLLLQGKDSEAEKDFEKARSLAPDMKADLQSRIDLCKKLRSTQLAGAPK
jgi:Tfp pilus assembly protein PilF